MEGKRLIQSIRLRNILSYGPDSEEFALEPLNVLIGPNASGKSNLISAISLLQAAPKDLLEPIQEGGGIREWVHKGLDAPTVATIDAVVSNPAGRKHLRHRFAFRAPGRGLETIGLEIEDEVIENESPYPEYDSAYFYYRYQRGSPVLNARVTSPTSDGSADEEGPRTQRQMQRENIAPNKSILAQMKDVEQYPEITYLHERYDAIRVYDNLAVDRGAPVRDLQLSSTPGTLLESDARNLALVVNALKNRVDTRRRIVDYLQRFWPRVDDIETQQIGEYTQLNVFEKSGLSGAISATRLSDGTLRYLCLLAILCHPEPPPLVCIEEPELGLHPDIMPTLAELLLDASQRMQIIVTTHSSQLVSALSDVPESVVVAERADGGTVLRRLEPERMAKWLEDYTLGTLWMMGELGGNP